MDSATKITVTPNDPVNWLSFDAAQRFWMDGAGDGIGFCFSTSDPFVGIDFDDCRDEVTGEIAPGVQQRVARLQTYTEVSASGQGLKSICRGTHPAGCGNRFTLGDGTTVEMYGSGQFFALTGVIHDGLIHIADGQAVIDEICAEPVESVAPARIKTQPESSSSFSPDLLTELTDTELLDVIGGADNGADFRFLFDGGTNGNPSDDDFVVAQRLSSYTHGDAERIQRMMSESLRWRQKFNERHSLDGSTYIEVTVKNAIMDTTWQWSMPSGLQRLAQARRSVRLVIERPNVSNDDIFAKPFVAGCGYLKSQRPAEWETLKAKLKSKGLSIQSLQRAMREDASHQSKEISPGELTTITALLPGLDVPPQLMIPNGYTITETSTARLVPDGVGGFTSRDIAHAVIYISERLQNKEEGIQYLRLSSIQGGRTSSLVVDRGTVMSATKLLALASQGFPVATVNVGEVSRYLHEFDAANRMNLPLVRVVSQLGRHGEKGKDSFLLGHKLISPSGELIELSESDEESGTIPGQDHIRYHPRSSGEKQIADSISTAGTLESWLRAISVIAGFPKVCLALYAAVASVLLEIIGAPNFVIDFANRTSSGKTTCLKVAASVLGNPDPQAKNGYMHSWSATKVFVERASATLNDLPLILDDTKQARSREFITETIYAFVFGKSKGRGSVSGLAALQSMRGILISSGEAQAKEMTDDGGARLRILEVTGSPFGGQTSELGALVTRLESDLYMSYGHALIAFVQWLSRNRALLPDLIARYKSRCEFYADASGNPQAGRLAKYAAAIDMAAYVLHQAVPMPWEYNDPFEGLWAEMTAEVAEAPPDVRAMQALEGWCLSNTTKFVGRHEVSTVTGNARIPHQGWVGIRKTGADANIAFYPHQLDAVVKTLGFDPDEVKREWRERGWLDIVPSEVKKRLTRKVEIEIDGTKTKTHMTVIKADTFRKVADLIGD